MAVILFDIDKILEENPPQGKAKRVKKETIKDVFEPYKELISKMLKYNKNEKGESVGVNYTNREIMAILKDKCEVAFETEEKTIMRDGKEVKIIKEVGFKRLTTYITRLNKELFKK